MSQRSSRIPVATLIVAFALCVLPGTAPVNAANIANTASPKLRASLPLSQSTESRLLERLERWRTSFWQDMVGLWEKAGARIDENGRSKA